VESGARDGAGFPVHFARYHRVRAAESAVHVQGRDGGKAAFDSHPEAVDLSGEQRSGHFPTFDAGSGVDQFGVGSLYEELAGLNGHVAEACSGGSERIDSMPGSHVHCDAVRQRLATRPPPSDQQAQGGAAAGGGRRHLRQY